MTKHDGKELGSSKEKQTKRPEHDKKTRQKEKQTERAAQHDER